VTFHGARCTVEGYDAAECSVVNVTGDEPPGAAHSLRICPSPLDRQVTEPTVLSPDAPFGATWSGGSAIELLVRT
jgi:hypothetical protein